MKRSPSLLGGVKPKVLVHRGCAITFWYVAVVQQFTTYGLYIDYGPGEPIFKNLFEKLDLRTLFSGPISGLIPGVGNEASCLLVQVE